MPFILSEFELEYSRQIFENIQISNFTKIRPVGTKLFHAGRQIGQTVGQIKVIIAFLHFANASNTI